MLTVFLLLFGWQELLAAGFGFGVTALSILLLNHWVLKPERDSRRWRAWKASEEMHRRHRSKLQNRRPKKEQTSN